MSHPTGLNSSAQAEGGGRLSVGEVSAGSRKQQMEKESSVQAEPQTQMLLSTDVGRVEKSFKLS